MTQKPVFMEGIFTLRNLRSMGAAAIIEIVIVFGVAGVLLWQQLRSVAVPQLASPPIVDFSPQPLPQSHIIPKPQVPEAPQLSEVPPDQESIPSPTVSPLQPLPPQSPVQPSQPSTDLVAQFSTRMLRAINDQKMYPRGSLLKGETGEAVVSFDYIGGVVSNIHVDRSSGSRELDAEAVQAVQKAVLPAKPVELVNLDHFVFHLTFSLGR